MRNLITLALCSAGALLVACQEVTEPSGRTQSPDAEAGDLAEIRTAGTRVVNSILDPGNGTCNATECTLREAINDPGTTNISFAPGLTGPITLAPKRVGGGPLNIGKSLTITGPGAGIVIRRRTTDPAFRIVRVDTGATVTLANLTLRNGKETDRPGGGILNLGTLALINCTVAATDSGGAIANRGPLTLTNSRIVDNLSGISNLNSALILRNSTVARNAFGGIIGTNGVVTLTHSTVVSNGGTGLGNTRGRIRVTNSKIADNAGGGIAVHAATLTLTGSEVVRNTAHMRAGGGVLVRRAVATIVNSTITGNSSPSGGGGVAVDGATRGAGLTMINSTVTRNTAVTIGGGIDVIDGAATIVNSTVVNNSAQYGGGISKQSEGSLELINSLVAQNDAPTGPDVLSDNSFQPIVATFNLIGDGTGSGITNADGNQVGNLSPNASPIDPLLGPLTDNGGPTRTYALEPGSPAIDAASSTDCPATDQRGVRRPQGPACDIGSYERE